MNNIPILVSILLNIQVNTEDLSQESNLLRLLEQFENKFISIDVYNSEKQTSLNKHLKDLVSCSAYIALPLLGNIHQCDPHIFH